MRWKGITKLFGLFEVSILEMQIWQKRIYIRLPKFSEVFLKKKVKSIKTKQYLDLDKLDMNKFHKDTTSKYFILQCKLQVYKNAFTFWCIF